ncbi:MAG: hypothetical protein FAF03_11815, partial [Epsilonproteobacteria bacterium]|nr:hypothetical protein [Campylobacterota bacterium]
SLYIITNAPVTAPLANLPPPSSEAVQPTTADMATLPSKVLALLASGASAELAKPDQKPALHLPPWALVMAEPF